LSSTHYKLWWHDGKLKIDAANLQLLKNMMDTFVFDILGLKNDRPLMMTANTQPDSYVTKRAKGNQDYATSDKIRDGLQKIGFQ